MLRTIPNNTHASLIRNFDFDLIDMIYLNKRRVEKEIVSEISLDGKMNPSATGHIGIDSQCAIHFA